MTAVDRPEPRHFTRREAAQQAYESAQRCGRSIAVHRFRPADGGIEEVRAYQSGDVTFSAVNSAGFAWSAPRSAWIKAGSDRYWNPTSKLLITVAGSVVIALLLALVVALVVALAV